MNQEPSPTFLTEDKYNSRVKSLKTIMDWKIYSTSNLLIAGAIFNLIVIIAVKESA